MTDRPTPRRAAVGRQRTTPWHHLNAIALMLVGAGIIAVIAASVGAMTGDGEGPPTGLIGKFSTPTPTAIPVTATPAPATATPTTPPSRDEPAVVACGDILAPLDKEHRLAADCAPGDLRDLPAGVSRGPQRMRAAAADAFAELLAAAKARGFALFAISAYRGYEDQVAAYEENRVIYGDQVDRFSARPGHSEHQLGTTVDVSTAGAGYELEPFEGTAEAAWVAENSWKHGFIVSYADGKEGVTGYAHEPWHIRYVGKEVAAKVQQSGLTLHEYLLRPR